MHNLERFNAPYLIVLNAFNGNEEIKVEGSTIVLQQTKKSDMKADGEIDTFICTADCKYWHGKFDMKFYLNRLPLVFALASYTI